MKSSSEQRSTPPARSCGPRIKPLFKPPDTALASPSQLTTSPRGPLPNPETIAGLVNARSSSRGRGRSPAAEATGVFKQMRASTVGEALLGTASETSDGTEDCWGQLGPDQPKFRYRLFHLRLLGEGGQADVLLGVDLDTRTPLAVKQFPNETNAQGTFALSVESFERELNALRELDDPHVVRLLGTDVDQVHARILLEFVPGSVNDMIKKIGPFSESLMIKYIIQVVKGLAYLHMMGVIHCDIKSDNLLVTADEVVKITDFGVCKTASRSSESWNGTVWFMSPEVAHGAIPSEPRDIWAMGCVVIEMLTGLIPWASAPIDCHPYYFLRKCTTSPPLDAGYPLATETVSFFNACTQVDPKSRPTANELLKHAMFSRLIPSPDVPSGYIFQDSPGPAA